MKNIVKHGEEGPSIYNETIQFINALERAVCDSAAKALTIHPLPHYDEKGRIKIWVTAATDYIRDSTIRNNLYTAYGSAVEALTEMQYDNLKNQWLSGQYSLLKQANRERTRPDLVLQKSVNGMAPRDVVWLDLTSNASQGHIYLKCGEGWRNMPVVGELFYQPLKPECIRFYGKMIESARVRQAVTRQRGRKTRIYQEFYQEMSSKVLPDLRACKSKAAVKKKLDDYFKSKLSHNIILSHNTIRSMLQIYRELGISPGMPGIPGMRGASLNAFLRQVGYGKKELNGRDKAAAQSLIESIFG